MGRVTDLQCATCREVLPPELFRVDARALRRGSRAYDCLSCESRARDARDAERMAATSTPTPATFADLRPGRYARRGDILYQVTSATPALAWLEQVSPPRPMGGGLAVDPGTAGQYEMLVQAPAMPRPPRRR